MCHLSTFALFCRIEAQPSSLGLPSLFNRINQAMPQLNKIMERAFSTNPFDNEEFNMPAMPSLASMPTLSFSMPRLPGGMFGRYILRQKKPVRQSKLSQANCNPDSEIH